LTVGRKNRRSSLFVSFFFPPLGGAGVFRPLKFCKYLPEWGWDTVVVCAEDKARDAYDESLLRDIPLETSVYRVKSDLARHRQISNWLACQPLLWRLATPLRGLVAFPDDKISWAYSTYEQCLKVIRSQSVDVIYTTSYPFSAHLVGLWLKRSTGLPWVADIRDPWSDGPLHMAGLPKWVIARHRRLERKVATEANHVVLVHPLATQSFRERYQDIQDKISCIPNGYDPDDFQRKASPVCARQRITIVHLGTFYGPYNPAPLKRALTLAERKCPDLLKQVKIVFVGGTPVPFDDLPGLEVEISDRVSHHEALQRLQDADIALNVYERAVGKHNISGKLYEYLACGRPILAIVPEDGTTAEIVRTCRAGFIADPDKPEDILAALKQCVEVVKGQHPFVPRDEEVQKFSRLRLAGNLSEIFSLICGNRAQRPSQAKMERGC